MFCSILIRVCL